jgi:hypothetical protein
MHASLYDEQFLLSSYPWQKHSVDKLISENFSFTPPLWGGRKKKKPFHAIFAVATLWVIFPPNFANCDSSDFPE